MKSFLNILIFMMQVIGVLFVGIGLESIWSPIAWIYYGAVFWGVGHVLYRALESEETEK